MDTTDTVKRITLAGLLIGVIAITGCKQHSPAGPPTSPPEVGFVAIVTAPVTLTMELSGRTSPHLIAEVRPQVGGII
ncbi:MAG: hypothetical protein WCV64_08465, partial [Desulfurivibrionaceae bacterium]